MKSQIHNFSTWVNETEPTVLFDELKLMLVHAGFTIEAAQEKHFQPQGYTCLFLLGESHLAVHTFPENGDTYIELSSCVKQPFNAFIGQICGFKVNSEKTVF